MVLTHAGVDGKYHRVGILSSDVFSTTNELSFLFKPPTYPRSPSDLAIKLKLERLATPTENSGSSNHGLFATTKSEITNITDSAETRWRIRDGPQSEAKSASSDTGTSTSAEDFKAADKTTTVALGKDCSNLEQGSHCDEEEPSEDLSEEVSLDHKVVYDFEDEEAWTEGVFEII